MGWAIHCREVVGNKRYALFSTVTMSYLTRQMDRARMIETVYQMDVEHRERALKLYPDSAPPPPDRESWQARVDFASVQGNSEWFGWTEEAAKCVPGCRCSRHRPVRSELYDSWW